MPVWNGRRRALEHQLLRVFHRPPDVAGGQAPTERPRRTGWKPLLSGRLLHGTSREGIKGAHVRRPTMRRLALLLAFALTCAIITAPAAPVPKEKPAAPLYLPTTVGTKWVMECGKEKVEHTVTAAEESKGEWAVSVEEVGGDGTRTVGWAASAEGVFAKLPSGKLSKVLEAPPKKGAKWTGEESFSNGKLEIAVLYEVVREERVKVPAASSMRWWSRSGSSGWGRCRANQPCGMRSATGW